MIFMGTVSEAKSSTNSQDNKTNKKWICHSFTSLCMFIILLTKCICFPYCTKLPIIYFIPKYMYNFKFSMSSWQLWTHQASLKVLFWRSQLFTVWNTDLGHWVINLMFINRNFFIWKPTIRCVHVFLLKQHKLNIYSLSNNFLREDVVLKCTKDCYMSNYIN